MAKGQAPVSILSLFHDETVTKIRKTLKIIVTITKYI